MYTVKADGDCHIFPMNFMELHTSLRYNHNLTASVVWWLACWPLVPEFAGSIPTEAVGFFPM
jgi:hypothetical protein